MRYRGGVISYCPRPLSVCVFTPPKTAVALFKHTCSRPVFKHAKLQTHACRPHAALGRHAKYTRAGRRAYWKVLILPIVTMVG